MDNKISFKGNLISNGIVKKPVVEAFRKATKAWPNDGLVLTKGSKEDCLQDFIMVSFKSPRAMAENSSTLLLRCFPENMSDKTITKKLVAGFKMLIEEANMNQKKYWIQQQKNKAFAVAQEQTKKAEITAKKGLYKISTAYESLAERNVQKAEALNVKISAIEEQASKNLDEIAGSDKELQTFSSAIIAINKG